jgi:S1-C subfamily serine protease
MKRNLFLLPIFIWLAFFLSSCTPAMQTQRTITTPIGWPTLKKSEAEFRKYLDDNADNLHVLEGIWTMHESGTWRNVYNPMLSGSLPSRIPYRLAIVKDTTNSGYDFVAVVLESEYSHWTPGSVKARFRKTAYENVFETLWFMVDFSSKRENYIIDESGIIKSISISYDPDHVIEYTTERILLKAYPPISGKSRPSSDKKLKASGSGFLLTTNGLVVTNYHVVEDASRIEVVFPEKNITKSASVRIKDTKNDIAILEIKDFTFSDISSQQIPFSFADANSVKVGQEVFTLGFPLGDIMGTKPRLSTGRINSLFGIQDDPRLFQISNPLQPGNSGGPLFNSKGDLVGIVVSSLNAKYFYENAGIIPQNVNFAVKASYLQSIISVIPEGDEAIKRKNSFKSDSMENLIEQLNPFIVQVRVY